MIATGKKTLHCLPYDLLYQIVSGIDCFDYINLSRTNRTLYSLLQNDLLAKRSIENTVRESKEAQLAFAQKISFREAIGRIYDVKDAVASASPYSVAVLAYASTFIYQEGVLSYYCANEIRVLNVHQADETEQVLNVRHVLHRIIPTFRGDETRNVSVELSLLHYSAGVLAILVEIGDSSPWLILLDVTPDGSKRPQGCKTGRLKFLRQLECTRRLFVRHNGTYLFYGVYSTIGVLSDPQWVVQCVDLTKGVDQAYGEPTLLDKFAGTDVGQNVCFEIFDSHLYGVTSVSDSDEEQLHWESFYEWVCIAPASCARRAKPERIFRRLHKEGPINDTWSEISLRKDEATGVPMIYECRREWRSGGSDCVRTYYTKDLKRPSEPSAKEKDQSTATTTREAEPTTPRDTSLISAHPVIIGGAGPSNINFVVPASTPPLERSKEPSKPPLRIEKNTHSEYTDTTSPRRDFILAKTKYRTYNPSASAFIDLINDPEPSTTVGAVHDRLRLRICSRKRKNPFESDNTLTKRLKDDSTGDIIPHSDERYVSNGIKMWPEERADEELIDLLCPAKRAANVHGVADERTLIYSVDIETAEPHQQQQQAIILVNFDSRLRIPSLRNPKRIIPVKSKTQEGKTDAPVGIDLPRLGDIKDRPKVSVGCDSQAGKMSRPRSIRKEQALYLLIDKGFWFDRKERDNIQ
ncbi:hypothetical protein BGW36DRAFT_428864 [Talaromyces proteolyticus]|uniref:F-box domain-containing protein n=1 Tax=Talaromyces proteolyticus TaxID=1131652 RepID=A0AAD4KLT8_9EURO|nr:uncharacterized protein BGW36DRAFT_428864 [Talaromyces proteolyticus]KAH8694965.1 hypothetical protein BGW36DRAFT_428864 [Talaromyces proteolyticus]